MPEQPDDRDRNRNRPGELAGESSRADQRRRARRLALAAGAVIAAAVVAGVVIASTLLNRPIGQASTPSPSASVANATVSGSAIATGPPETASPSPTARPTPPSGPAEVAWTTGGHLDGNTRVVERIRDVWIVGGSASVNGAFQAAVWTSADGHAWDGPTLLDPEPPPEPAGAEPGEWFPDQYGVNGFVEWRGTLYAYGQHNFGCCDGYEPTLWQSADGGVTWSAVETMGTGFDTAQVPLEASTTPNGELVVYSTTGLGGGAATFITADLETWTMNPIGEFDSFNTPGGFAGSPDAMIAVGTHLPPYAQAEERRPEQRAWRSVDGRSWSPLSPPRAQGELWDLTWDPASERFVVVGSDASGQPWAWLTADGTSWAASQLADAPGHVIDIAATDGLIAAVGSVETPDAEQIAWTSHDGITWWVALIDAASGVNGVAVTNNAAVTVGWSGNGGDSETWVGLGRLVE
jgi:hypothetical protein